MNDNRLRVVNVESLKITKIKSWAIYFEVDGKTYLLHEDSDGYERGTTLYKKTNDKNGRYELEFISGSWYGMSDLYIRRKETEAYSLINPYEFILKLVKADLVRTNNKAIELLIKQHNKQKKIHKLASDLEIETRNRN